MKKILPFLAAIFFTSAANAADIYKLDPLHTNITWSANHFGFSNPSGKFTTSSGVIILDEAHPQNSSVAISIKSDSVQTGFPTFDTNLKSVNFFNVEKYPEIKFISKNIIVQGKRAKIIGDLTLLGETREVTLDTKLNKVGVNSYTQKKTAGFSAIVTIKRSDFGMEFGLPGIADSVKIAIEAEGILDNTLQNKAESNKDVSLIKDDIFVGTTLTISPSTSSINFVGTKEGTLVNGSFTSFAGKVVFDPENLDKAAISIDIDTASINLPLDTVTILKTSDWLDFAQFPKANFTATKFIKTPTNQYIAKGTLNLKGRKAPVEAIFTLKNYTGSSAIAAGSINIKRSDFGIGNQNISKAGGVADDVQIKFTISAKK